MKLTIDFHTLDDGSVKATVYEGTNKYLYEAHGYSEYSALLNIATRFVFYQHEVAQNESLNKRAD